MVKIALDAGHGFNTAGKRSPDGEREWFFNNQVLLACTEKLNEYEGVSILRLDDATGKTDVPLKTRTDRANRWNAEVLVSIHHNANTGSWGSWGGTETYVYPTASKSSFQLAEIIQPKLVQAMGLPDRGIKKKNLLILRETNMPAVLTEGGFSDSVTDIKVMRSTEKLKAQGKAIAEGLAAFFKLKKKKEPVVQDSLYRLLTGTFTSKAEAEKAAALLRKTFGWTVYVKDA